MGGRVLNKRGIGALAAIVGFVLAAGALAPASAGTLAGYRLLLLDGQTVKWGAPVRGTGATVTYALVAARTDFPDARNCRSVVPVDALLAASRVRPSIFAVEVARAFDAWAAAANIVFRVADPAVANILIGAEADPFGRAFTNVTRATSAAPGGIAPIARSVICLNPAEPWKVGFDGNLESYDLRYALMHEIGHAIGLDHPGVKGELMDFRYREQFATLMEGDRAGALALYGPRSEEVPVAALAKTGPRAVAGAAEVGLGN